MAVGHQRGAVKAIPGSESHVGGDLVAGEADDAGEGQCREVVQGLWVQETVDRFESGDRGGDEDRGYDDVAGGSFAAAAPCQEGDGEGDGGQGVSPVVDQVGQQRDRAGDDEHHRLDRGRDHQHREADHNGAHASTGPDDGGIDQAVGMAVVAFVVMIAVRGNRPAFVVVVTVVVMRLVLVIRSSLRAQRQPQVTMLALERVAMGDRAVAVGGSAGHLTARLRRRAPVTSPRRPCRTRLGRRCGRGVSVPYIASVPADTARTSACARLLWRSRIGEKRLRATVRHLPDR